MQHKENGSVFLYQEMENQPVIIDEFTYDMMMDYLCQVHMVQIDEKQPANGSIFFMLHDLKPGEIQTAKQDGSLFLWV